MDYHSKGQIEQGQTCWFRNDLGKFGFSDLDTEGVRLKYCVDEIPVLSCHKRLSGPQECVKISIWPLKTLPFGSPGSATDYSD